MDRRAGVISLGHQRGHSVLDQQYFVEGAVVGIDPLEGKALMGVEPMIIGLFEIGFLRQRVPVVLVRRIGRCVPARRDHLNHQQAVRHAVGFGQDIGDMAHIGAFAAHLLGHRIGPDHLHRALRKGRGRTDCKFQVGPCRHRPVTIARHIDRRRLAVERALPPPHFAQRFTPSAHAASAGNENQADFPVPRHRRNALPGSQLVQRKPHIPPPGAFRRHIDHLAGVPGWFDEQLSHHFASFFSVPVPVPVPVLVSARPVSAPISPHHHRHPGLEPGSSNRQRRPLRPRPILPSLPRARPGAHVRCRALRWLGDFGGQILPACSLSLGGEGWGEGPFRQQTA